MTSAFERSLDSDTCRKLISLGYARSNHVRLYGQEVELVSDPFPHHEGGIAIEVITKTEPVSRTVKLPIPVLHVASQRVERRPEKRPA